MKKENASKAKNKIEGPAAPKDPVEKRSGFYIMLDTVIEASSRSQGKPSQEIYLEGRLKNKAKLTGGIEDEEMLKLLESCQGFRKLVHSIGVSVVADDDYSGSINFIMQNWGKKDKYESGTTLKASCPADGSETVLKLEDYQWSEDDDVPGKFAFEFDNLGEIAKASIKFYLNDGFEAPEITIEEAVDFDSKDYQTMIAKSLLSMGNNRRLKTVIEKAERGEEVTIAYIGGSITQGAAAKPINTNSYAYKSYQKFKEIFAKNKDNVHFVKAGVGGTSSELGMIRYQRDILRDGTVEPDIVIIEFAVNDEGDETKGVCYEGLVLKALFAENKPAVILLFSVFENDWNLQDRLSPVGYHYNLPMVSVKDAVVDQFKQSKEEGNVISKRQYFYDIFHPTNDGHTVMADCLAYLFSESKKAAKDEKDIMIDKEPVIGNYFKDVSLLDRKDNTNIAKIEEGGFNQVDTELQMVEMNRDSHGTAQFPHNWMKTASSGDDSFKMTINSKGLVLVFKDSGSNEFAKADVFVDGEYILTADPHINNWTHCNPVILYQEEVTKEHLVEIKMAEGEEDKSFTILGFGYVE
ncbi:SGNH/GDSL hydrolase family protein [Natronospora cellulosivora (SeqCode)]